MHEQQVAGRAYLLQYSVMFTKEVELPHGQPGQSLFGQLPPQGPSRCRERAESKLILSLKLYFDSSSANKKIIG